MGAVGQRLSSIRALFRRGRVIIAFPMAGESRRFSEVGYLQPKFALDVFGVPLFDHAVSSFRRYFNCDGFLFITRDHAAAEFATARCEQLGIADFRIACLNAKTGGQAETVMLGLESAQIADSETLTVFNIDTFRPGYCKPALVAGSGYAGYLEVFRGTGEGWSFVLPNELGAVVRVAEKLPISDLCSTGLYHFRRAGDFRWAYRHPPPAQSPAESRERYVAPLYNALIGRGDRIGFDLVPADQVIFSGTPEQYELLLGSEEIRRQLRP